MLPGKVLEEVSTAFHGGAAAVKEQAVLFPLQKKHQ